MSDKFTEVRNYVLDTAEMIAGAACTMISAARIPPGGDKGYLRKRTSCVGLGDLIRRGAVLIKQRLNGIQSGFAPQFVFGP